MLDHILFKTNADITAALTALTAAPSSDNEVKGHGIGDPILIEASCVINMTADERCRFQLYKQDDETTKLLDKSNADAIIGMAAGEATLNNGKGFTKLSTQLNDGDVLVAKATNENASKDIGMLLQLLYGNHHQQEDGVDVWIDKTASSSATVDTWKEAFTIGPSDGLDPKKTYYLYEILGIPVDSGGCIAVKAVKKGWQTEPAAPMLGIPYKFRDHMHFQGTETVTFYIFDGIASKQPEFSVHFKEV